MLSKLTHLVIIFTLILATSGITVTRHYCGSTLEFTSVDSINASSCCGNCLLCHNVTHFIKVNDDFFTSDFKIDAPKIINLNWLAFTINPDLTLVNNPFVSHQNFSPLISPYSSRPTLAFLQVFRC